MQPQRKTRVRRRIPSTATMSVEALEKALEAAEQRVVSGNDPEGIYASEAATLQAELEGRLARQHAGSGLEGKPSSPAQATHPSQADPFARTKAALVNLRAVVPTWVFLAAGLLVFGLSVYGISRWWNGRAKR